MTCFRTIKLEPEYQRALDGLRKETSRAEEYHCALEWFLSRNADMGYSVANRPYLRVWPFHVGAKRYAVYYKYDADHVTMVALFSVPGDSAWQR